nr:ribonuclease H-like domain-containing protein [Tanacetum cinerariifolium]
MPPRMRTRSASQPAVELQGGGTGERVGRGGRGRGPRGDHAQQLQNLLPAILAQDMSGCSIDQKVKYTTGSLVGKALTPGYATYTDRMVAATEPNTMQIYGTLTDEAVKNGSIKKVEKRGNMREPSKDKNGRDDNKRAKTGNAFDMTANPVGRENTYVWPKCTTCKFFHAPGGPCRTCFNCNCPEVIVPTGRYVVPTGRVIVATGRYVVPAGSDNESDNASVHNEATNTQQHSNIQPHIITTVSNNKAKFPYLKKDEYEVWAMKMEYWITNNDMNIWKRESKARTTLLQSIPDDHVADFYYMDDAREIWNAVKAKFGGNAESKKMRKSMLKQEFLEFRTGDAGEFALMGVTSENGKKNELAA